MLKKFLIKVCSALKFLIGKLLFAAFLGFSLDDNFWSSYSKQLVAENSIKDTSFGFFAYQLWIARKITVFVWLLNRFLTKRLWKTKSNKTCARCLQKRKHFHDWNSLCFWRRKETFSFWGIYETVKLHKSSSLPL